MLWSFLFALDPQQAKSCKLKGNSTSSIVASWSCTKYHKCEIQSLPGDGSPKTSPKLRPPSPPPQKKKHNSADFIEFCWMWCIVSKFQHVSTSGCTDESPASTRTGTNSPIQRVSGFLGSRFCCTKCLRCLHVGSCTYHISVYSTYLFAFVGCNGCTCVIYNLGAVLGELLTWGIQRPRSWAPLIYPIRHPLALDSWVVMPRVWRYPSVLHRAWNTSVKRIHHPYSFQCLVQSLGSIRSIPLVFHHFHHQMWQRLTWSWKRLHRLLQ